MCRVFLLFFIYLSSDLRLCAFVLVAVGSTAFVRHFRALTDNSEKFRCARKCHSLPRCPRHMGVSYSGGILFAFSLFSFFCSLEIACTLHAHRNQMVQVQLCACGERRSQSTCHIHNGCSGTDFAHVLQICHDSCNKMGVITFHRSLSLWMSQECHTGFPATKLIATVHTHQIRT